MTLRNSILILFALALSVNIQAQTTGGDPQNSLLPEINPQDIEIRSEFKARFPGLRRQPILGFNPKPRVFRIDPNRMPFMETKDEAVASVAMSQLDRPDAPVRNILRTPDRTRGFVRAGIGNFITPELEGYVYQGFNSKSSITGNVDYRSSEGHLDSQDSGFRYFNGDVAFNTKIKNDTKLTISAGGLSDFNRLYNLDPVIQNTLSETAKKDYAGLGGKIALQKTDNALQGWDVTLGGNVYAVDLDAGSSNYTGEVNEQRGELEFSRHWAGSRLYETYYVNGSVRAGSYQYTGVDAQQWIDTRASIEYRKLFNFSAHVSGKMGLAYISDGFSNKIYITPELKIRYNLKDAIIITGGLYGNPEMKGVQGHHQVNRFLNFETQLRQSYTSGVYGEIAFQAFEGNRIFGGISYELTSNYSYYDQKPTSILAPGGGGQTINTFYETKYAKANVFELFGGITQQLVPEKFWFDARFYARRPKLSDAGDIPFEERIGVNGSLSYKPVPKLTIRSWAEYVGKRQAVTADEELNAFALINGGAEYQITNRFGVYVKVLNILGQKYEIWRGYQERPLQAYGGLTFKF